MKLVSYWDGTRHSVDRELHSGALWPAMTVAWL
jgi:hypothetical protein